MSTEHCFHCGLPVPKGASFNVIIQNQSRSMCCAGCQAVAQTIVDIGMEQFYDHREPAAPGALPAAEIVPEFVSELEVWNQEQLQTPYVSSPETKKPQAQAQAEITDLTRREINLLITGITCAACAWLIEQQLNKLTGIYSCKINSSSHTALVSWDADQIGLGTILQAIAKVGYKAEPYSTEKAEQQIKRDNKAALIRIGLAGLGTMQVMMYAVGLYLGAFDGIEDQYKQFLRWVSALVATPVYFYSGWPFLRGAFNALTKAHLTMDVPVAIALTFAYFASLWATANDGPEVYFDSVCMFIFFLSLGRYLEMRARHRAQQFSIRLNQANQQVARLLMADGTTSAIPANQLRPGQRLLVKAGETIPSDGEVESGTSSVNEAMLTGEALPIVKQPGSEVVGGTLNVEHPLTIQVSRAPAESTLSAIKQLLNRASLHKPPTFLVADKLARYFVGAVLLVAASVYFFWWQRSPDDAFWIMLSVLVVTCPCALSLATPTAITATTSALFSIGFLSTRAHTVEALRGVDQVVFDKTGTLTKGDYQLSKVLAIASTYSPECLQSIAVGIESSSEHPIAKAFHGLSQSASVTDIEVSPGQGIGGNWQGKAVRLGTPEFALGSASSSTLAYPDGDLQWLLLSIEQQPCAWFGVEDQLREGSHTVVQWLLQRGIQCHILSGDNSGRAASLGQQLGISQVRQGVSPEGKLEYLKSLQSSGAKVLMVGDGINDGPVLAGADVSIAMASAADLAKVNADGVLLSPDFQSLIGVFNGAQACFRVIRQNLSWALLYNLVALPLAACGLIAPWASALGMSASSLLVVLNALRIQPMVEQNRWK